MIQKRLTNKLIAEINKKSVYDVIDHHISSILKAVGDDDEKRDAIYEYEGLLLASARAGLLPYNSTQLVANGLKSLNLPNALEVMSSAKSSLDLCFNAHNLVSLANDVHKYSKDKKDGELTIYTKMLIAISQIYSDEEAAKAIKMLVEEKGADVDGTDLFGNNALTLATQAHNFYMCMVLIENGANPRAVNKSMRRTPLHYAAAVALPEYDLQLEALKMLCKISDVNAKDIRGFTPLLLAAMHPNPFIIVELVKHGADYEVEHPYLGETALSLICEYTALPGIKDIVDQLANVEMDAKLQKFHDVLTKTMKVKVERAVEIYSSV